MRGAFSGALSDRVGKFQAADEGTLYLDEIGDLDVRLQAKLLRVLQEGVVELLGTNRRRTVDVRIISSTNRDLEQAMRAGRFRENLYFRLNVLRVHLPPLRERREDIPMLAEDFLASFARELARPVPRLDPAALAMLEDYAWPGNVRELRNLMERAAVLCQEPVVSPAPIRAFLPVATPSTSLENRTLTLTRALADLERRMVREALAASGDNKPTAAKRLGIGERTLRSKLKKHGL